MVDFIWYWDKGSIRVYTRKMDLAEDAMKRGFLIFGKMIKPRVFASRR